MFWRTTSSIDSNNSGQICYDPDFQNNNIFQKSESRAVQIFRLFHSGYFSVDYRRSYDGINWHISVQSSKFSRKIFAEWIGKTKFCQRYFLDLSEEKQNREMQAILCQFWFYREIDV